MVLGVLTGPSLETGLEAQRNDDVRGVHTCQMGTAHVPRVHACVCMDCIHYVLMRQGFVTREVQTKFRVGDVQIAGRGT